MIRVFAICMIWTICFGTGNSPAMATKVASGFMDGLDKCVLAFSKNGVAGAFADWTVVKPFQKPCRACSTVSGSFKHPESGTVIEVLTKEVPSPSFGTNFECSVPLESELPRPADINPLFSKWLASKLAEGTVQRIPGAKSISRGLKACRSDGAAAAIAIILTGDKPTGDKLYFEMGQYGGRETPPPRCD